MPKHHNRDVGAISRLRSEPNLHSAICIFQAADKARVRISPYVYIYLLHGYACCSDQYAALKILGHLEKGCGSRIPAGAYYHITQLYLETNNLAAAKEAFPEFKKAAQLHNVSYELFPASHNLGQHPTPIGLWNLMIRIYFHAGRQTEALTVLELCWTPLIPPSHVSHCRLSRRSSSDSARMMMSKLLLNGSDGSCRRPLSPRTHALLYLPRDHVFGGILWTKIPFLDDD